MLSAAKHLYVNRARPFATLGVTVLKQQEHDRAKLSMDFVRTLEPDHDARHTLIEAILWKIASRALELGVNVILDFGFWAREEREDYRLRAKQLGASSEVHFLDVSEDELFRRLEERNSQPSQETFYISVEMMNPWIEFFQKPTPDELLRRE